MKEIYRMILVSISLLILSGCQSKPTDNANPTLPEQQPSIATTYPLENTYMIESIYPSGEIPETQVPQYLLPGFITATPDSKIAPIVISEVRHENNSEIITIKNISNDEIDISAYMIFSPEAGERKILPNDLKLSSGETYQIYNGENLNYPQEQIWLNRSILNNPLDEVWLLNKAARIVFYFTYYPTVVD